jgi:hypothetical protein
VGSVKPFWNAPLLACAEPCMFQNSVPAHTQLAQSTHNTPSPINIQVPVPLSIAWIFPPALMIAAYSRSLPSNDCIEMACS